MNQIPTLDDRYLVYDNGCVDTLKYHIIRGQINVSVWDNAWTALNVFDGFLRTIDHHCLSWVNSEKIYNQVNRVPPPLSLFLRLDMTPIAVERLLPKQYLKKAYCRLYYNEKEYNTLRNRCQNAKRLIERLVDYIRKNRKRYKRKIDIHCVIPMLAMYKSELSIITKKDLRTNVNVRKMLTDEFIHVWLIKYFGSPLLRRPIISSTEKTKKNYKDDDNNKISEFNDDKDDDKFRKKKSSKTNNDRDDDKSIFKKAKKPSVPRNIQDNLETFSEHDNDDCSFEDDVGRIIDSTTQFDSHNTTIISKRLYDVETNNKMKYDIGNKAPVIVIETFCSTDESRKVVRGPAGEKPVVDYKDFINGIQNHKNKTLSRILMCPTSSAYVYGFSQANLRPHFVIDRKGAAEYMKSMLNLNAYEEASIMTVSSDDLRKPIQIKDSKSIPDFYMFSDKTTEFKTHFANGDRINYKYWMKAFDENNYKKNKNDQRGFKDVLDIGIGRNGVHEDAAVSQKKGKKFVAAKPAFVNSNRQREYKEIGEFLDIIQEFVDEYFDENGMLLFSDMNRDSDMTEDFRKKTNSKKCRAEAVTIVRQLLGTVEDLKNGKVTFEGTVRHWYVRLLSGRKRSN